MLQIELVGRVMEHGAAERRERRVVADHQNGIVQLVRPVRIAALGEPEFAAVTVVHFAGAGIDPFGRPLLGEEGDRLRQGAQQRRGRLLQCGGKIVDVGDIGPAINGCDLVDALVPHQPVALLAPGAEGAVVADLEQDRAARVALLIDRPRPSLRGRREAGDQGQQKNPHPLISHP